MNKENALSDFYSIINKNNSICGGVMNFIHRNYLEKEELKMHLPKIRYLNPSKPHTYAPQITIPHYIKNYFFKNKTVIL